jgi:hypothetical protein
MMGRNRIAFVRSDGRVSEIKADLISVVTVLHRR